MSRQTFPVGPSVSRRRFLKSATAMVAAPTIVSASALARGDAAPSERLSVAVIGTGGQGTGHLYGMVNRPEVRVAAVCDPIQSKRDHCVEHVQNHYANLVGAKGSYRDCVGTGDFREVIARPDIDAIVIAAPEFWHALITVAGVAAGKAVYCEKALSLTVGQGQKVCEAVRRHGGVFQIGTQQRSAWNFRYACELARNGYLGELRTIKIGVPGGRELPEADPKEAPAGIDYEMWLGPAPYTPYNDLKCSFNWYFMSDYCVGWIQSWGVHHTDIALWGEPRLHTGRVEVEGSAVFPKAGLADTSVTWDVNLTPENGPRLSFSSNEKNPQGCRFEGDEGWVLVNRSGIWAEPASLLKVRLRPGDERLYESNDHMANFLECARHGGDPIAPVEAGHRATVVTLIADIATRLRRKLIWDWDAERFVGDPVANRMLDRPMRAPWRL